MYDSRDSKDPDCVNNKKIKILFEIQARFPRAGWKRRVNYFMA